MASARIPSQRRRRSNQDTNNSGCLVGGSGIPLDSYYSGGSWISKLRDRRPYSLLEQFWDGSK